MMPRGLICLVIAGMLAGCPAPTDSTQQTPGGPAGAGGPGGGPGGPGGGPGGPGGGGPGGGPGGADGIILDLNKMAAQTSQEEIAAGEHITISGKVDGECNGLVRVDVISGKKDAAGGPAGGGPGEGGPGEGGPGAGGPGGPGGGDGPMGPLTAFEMDGVGEFSMVVPKGTEGMINALCDEDKDGVIKGGSDKLARGEMLEKLEADKDGIVLTLDDTGPPGAGGGGPGGPGGGQGGPPPEGGPGGPPAGGPGGPPPEGAPSGEGAPAGE